MSRWTRMQADSLEHVLFAGQPRDEHSAWYWLISNAAWKDTTHRVKGTVVKVPRGSIFVTVKTLMSEWKWGSGKVQKFLRLLASEGMISTKSGTGKLFITICNYNKFQDSSDKSGTRIDTPIDTEAARKRHTKDTTTPLHTTTLLDGREAEIVEALGKNARFQANGAFLVLSEPINWLDSGCDFDLDILPIIQSLSASNPNIKSWKYFSNAVFEARDARLAPAPDGSNVAQFNQPQSKQSNGDKMIVALAELAAEDVAEREVNQ